MEHRRFNARSASDTWITCTGGKLVWKELRPVLIIHCYKIRHSEQAKKSLIILSVPKEKSIIFWELFKLFNHLNSNMILRESGTYIGISVIGLVSRLMSHGIKGNHSFYGTSRGSGMIIRAQKTEQETKTEQHSILSVTIYSMHETA